ncbi:DUF1835 domain-containing protein [Psychrobacillus sp.]|uniref:DUF1835 domain-containing protein n=1 Tax=Psychrobacillus sp. TaxID=1871623 RepID=UPI0028BF230A|nr:DUF1835 domain-containing protein [Psychrobacillus sp.]
MKTKVNYPFIYFLLEPNVVLVYRVETLKYVTVSDFNDGNKCEAFEINHPDDFETFEYKERQSVEGRTFFLNEDGMNKIVEEINKQIQKILHEQSRRNEFGPVHIVTSESAAGLLNAGVERPRNVIAYPDSFSIGPLWILHEKTGQSFRKEWLFENINDKQDEYGDKCINTLREMEDIGDHVPIYIWYGNNADEQVGLRYFLYIMRDKTNDIFLINSTELYEKSSATEEKQSIFHTSQMDSEMVRQFFANNKEYELLTDEKRIQFQREWEKLSETKEVLRLWIDDELRGLPENHYDLLIIETLEKMHHEQGMKDFIKAGSVIGEVFTKMNSYLNYYFLEFRVRHLIYSGVLELKGIPKSEWHYSVKLR